MNQRNYQKELDRTLETIQREDRVPRLLLHCCCAPCSSYVLEYLSRYFQITVLYYNPNIYPPSEYEMRVEEEEKLIEKMSCPNPVTLKKGRYVPEEFYETVRGYENSPEGGDRCERCYELRLREAALEARKGGYDFFTTTLSISPLKSAQKLNSVAEKVSREYGVPCLPSDFKKRNGYKRSLELSEKYDLYRQNYCGCRYSIRT